MVNVCRELPSKFHWCWIIMVFLVSQIIPKIHSSSMVQLFHGKKLSQFDQRFEESDERIKWNMRTHLKTKNLKNNLCKENHLQIEFNFLQFVKLSPTAYKLFDVHMKIEWFCPLGQFTNHKDVERHWAWSTFSNGQTLE